MWLFCHESLLTNAQRQRRHLTEDPSCPRCKMKDETCLHALRDCSIIHSVWCGLLEPESWSGFFSARSRR